MRTNRLGRQRSPDHRVAGLLALAGAGAVAFCLLYAIWWLLVYWAPW